MFFTNMQGFESHSLRLKGNGGKSPFPLFTRVAGVFIKTQRTLKKPFVLHFILMMQHEMQHENDQMIQCPRLGIFTITRQFFYSTYTCKRTLSFFENVPLHVRLFKPPYFGRKPYSVLQSQPISGHAVRHAAIIDCRHRLVHKVALLLA